MTGYKCKVCGDIVSCFNHCQEENKLWKRPTGTKKRTKKNLKNRGGK